MSRLGKRVGFSKDPPWGGRHHLNIVVTMNFDALQMCHMPYLCTMWRRHGMIWGRYDKVAKIFPSKSAVTPTFLEPNQGRAECTEVRVGWLLRNLGQQTGAWGKALCNWQGRFHPLSPWDVNHTKTLMDLLPSNPQTEWQRKIHRQMNKTKQTHVLRHTH